MLFGFELTIEATQIKVVKWKSKYVVFKKNWIGNCRHESLLTCILAVDAEILVVVLVVAAAESSGCAHLGDVRVGSLIVQAVQTAIKSLDRFIILELYGTYYLKVSKSQK